MLENGLSDKLSIQAIGEECGFSNKTSFYRAFKKFTSTTPNEYLKNKNRFTNFTTNTTIMKTTTVKDYIKSVSEDRKPYFNKLQQTILDHIPAGFEECSLYGMIGYAVPLSIYPDGYHCRKDEPLPFVNLASQKNFIALYHMGIYANKDIHDWFVEQYPKHCKYKLDMGKSCVRFKKMDDIPFELIAQLMQKYSVDDWIKTYEKAFKK
jgi:hypothetical protein